MDGFNGLRTFIHDGYGICLGSEKDYLVVSRLTPLLRETGLANLRALYDMIIQEPKGNLAQHVVAALTTNETSWFRDGRPFEFFKNTVLPQLLKTKSKDQTIRIWSAAASTGQEAYSIAMCLDEGQHVGAPINVNIVASDISGKALEQARAGLYTQFEMDRGLSATLCDRYFSKEGAQWRIKPALKSQIAFRHINLIEIPADLGRFDVIFCRNVMIYFDDQTRNKVMASLVQHLATGGYLFFGSAEAMSGYAQDMLTMISPGIYQKNS